MGTIYVGAGWFREGEWPFPDHASHNWQSQGCDPGSLDTASLSLGLASRLHSMFKFMRSWLFSIVVPPFASAPATDGCPGNCVSTSTQCCLHILNLSHVSRCAEVSQHGFNLHARGWPCDSHTYHFFGKVIALAFFARFQVFCFHTVKFWEPFGHKSVVVWMRSVPRSSCSYTWFAVVQLCGNVMEPLRGRVFVEEAHH